MASSSSTWLYVNRDLAAKKGGLRRTGSLLLQLRDSGGERSGEGRQAEKSRSFNCRGQKGLPWSAKERAGETASRGSTENAGEGSSNGHRGTGANGE